MGSSMPLTLNLLHFDRPADDRIIVREAWGAPSQNQSQLLGAKFSPDGRYGYFYSQSKLVQGDLNNEMDIYRKDFVTGEITLMSVKGVPTGHYDLDVSRDGRYLLFSSTASNLVTGDTNGFEDVFRMDLSTRAITRVSMSFSFLQGNGDSYSGRFSPDGQYVVFTSDANLAAAGDSNSWSDIYVRKIDSGGVMLVSTLPDGQQGDGTNWDAKFSADGSQVLFSSTGFNANSGESQVLIKDVTPGGNVITTGGELKIVSVDKGNNWGTNHSLEAQITPDGRYVVFASLANNLVPLKLERHLRHFSQGSSNRRYRARIDNGERQPGLRQQPAAPDQRGWPLRHLRQHSGQFGSGRLQRRSGCFPQGSVDGTGHPSLRILQPR